jgi:SAM-dependent methyltransferase
MKPTVAEYLRQKGTVRGWLQDIDARVILAIDRLQQASAVSGDLLEIGVSYGQSAILLGYCLQASERLVVCDSFEETTASFSRDRADDARHLQQLRRSDFEQNYLRFHPTLPNIIAGRSNEIDRDRLAAHFRLIHVANSHTYADVRADIVVALRLVGPGGVVILDNWSQPHAPGVALAIWEEYVRGEFIPLCLTQSKMYGTWDRGGLTADAVDEWAQRQPDVDISEKHQLGRYDVRRYSLKPPPVTTAQAADPLWRRAVRYIRLTRSGRQ